MFEVQTVDPGNPIAPLLPPEAPAGNGGAFFAGSRALIAGIEWPVDAACTGLRLARLWTGRKGRVVCEHLFSIRTPSETVELPLQSVIGGESQPGLAIHRRASFSEGAILGLCLSDESGGAVWCSPDRDPYLPWAASLFQPQRLRALLDRSAGASSFAPGESDDPPSDVLRMRLRSYRLGRRCVVQVSPGYGAGSPGLYLKMVRRLAAPRQIDRLRQLGDLLPARSEGKICTPPIVDYLPEQRLLMTRDVTPPWAATPYDSAARADAAYVLAALHGIACDADDRTHTSLDEIETVARWSRVLPVVCPDADFARLQAIHARLEQGLAAWDDAGMTLVHRDFYHSQLLRSDGEVWLVDLDTLCRAHPELDIAVYFAHALFDGLTGGCHELTPGCGLGEFLDGYRSRGGAITPNRLAWYLGCALARLGSMHLARGVDRSVVGRLWDVAEALAADPRVALAAMSATGAPRRPGEEGLA